MPKSSLTFYPAYCFAASPTYNTWVKVTGADLQGLSERNGFEGQNLYFHLNHPIQWVQVTGVVINFEAHDWLWIFHVDDGSGIPIEVVIPREKQPEAPLAKSNELITLALPRSRGISASGNTVDLSGVEIGALVKVKGSIKEFREEKQIALERLVVLHDTAAELQAWEDLCSFRRNVLSRPWSLTNTEQTKLLEDEKHAARCAEEKRQRRRLRERKKQEKEARRRVRREGHEEDKNHGERVRH